MLMQLAATAVIVAVLTGVRGCIIGSLIFTIGAIYLSS